MLALISMQFSTINYNFYPCGIFEKKMSFIQILNKDLEQGKLMMAINSRK